jgi:hypothetical protein
VLTVLWLTLLSPGAALALLVVLQRFETRMFAALPARTRRQSADPPRRHSDTLDLAPAPHRFLLSRREPTPRLTGRDPDVHLA